MFVSNKIIFVILCNSWLAVIAVWDNVHKKVS